MTTLVLNNWALIFFQFHNMKHWDPVGVVMEKKLIFLLFLLFLVMAAILDSWRGQVL